MIVCSQDSVGMNRNPLCFTLRKQAEKKIKNEKKDRERIRNNHKKENKIELIEIEEYV